MGNTRYYLKRAIELVNSRIGTVTLESGIYRSEPWGLDCAQWFLNQVIMVETALEPGSVLEYCLQIEAELGRTRSGNGYEPRTIDIDIIFFGKQVIDTPDLKVPHPLMHQRNFVLRPLCDIAPNFVHPVIGSTIQQLTELCGDKLMVETVG